MLANDEDARFAFRHALALRTLGTGMVEVIGTELRIDEEVHLTTEVDLTGWERIYDAGCFHLDEEPAPLGFDADQPVRLELRLRARVAAAFDEPEALLSSLLTDGDSPLRHTEAWYAIEAIQRLDVPGEEGAWVDVGIRTRFATA